MATDTEQWRTPLDYPPDLPRVTFRDGPGGDMPHEWAAFMLRTWRDAEVGNAKPPKFSDVLKAAAVHFMMGGDQ